MTGHLTQQTVHAIVNAANRHYSEADVWIAPFRVPPVLPSCILRDAWLAALSAASMKADYQATLLANLIVRPPYTSMALPYVGPY